MLQIAEGITLLATKIASFGNKCNKNYFSKITNPHYLKQTSMALEHTQHHQSQPLPTTIWK